MKYILTILFLSAFLSAFAQQQTGNFDYLTSNRRFTLAGRTVKGISNDTALLTASADSLVTQYAIRGYIDQRLLNTPDSSYIFDPEQFIVNGWNVSIRFPQDPGEPLFTGSPAYNLTQAHIDFLDSLMLALRDSNYTYFDDRDFYNDGTAALPFRIVRYDNHYIDSLFASVSSGGGGGGSGGPYHLPYNADTSYYLAGDSTLHKLPTYTPFDSTSLSSRINQKQNKINLTTLGQTGASTLINDTLNIPNYFFATNDSIDYSFASITPIYNENSPGDYVVTGSGVAADRNNTTFPFKLLKSVDVGGWNAGDYVSFKNATTANSTSYTFLRGFVRLKQAEPIGNSLSLEFYNNGVSVSKQISMLNYGLDKSNVGNYMNVTIPMSAFGFTNTAFDEIRLVFGGGSSAQGLYLDYFLFQNATTVENKYITSLFRSPGTLDVYGVIGGQNVLMHTDSIGTPVDTQYLRRDININTTAIAGKENAITASNTTGKYWNGYKQFVSLNTDSVTEATNKYYTDTKARAALTLTTTGTSGAASYNSSTGVLNVPNYIGQRFGIEDNTSVVDRSMNFQGHSLDIYNSSTFDIVAGNDNVFSYVYASPTRTYLTHGNNNIDGNNNVAQSYIEIDNEDVKITKINNSKGINSIQRFSDGSGYIPLSVNGHFADSAGNITVTTGGGGSTYTDAQARAAISLTTTGTSGAATYNNSTGVLNVPQYASSVGTITWLGTAYNINSGNNITLATPTTSDISEGSNPYFTNARARAAISVTGSGTYDNTTGVINITGGGSSGWALGGNTLTNSGTQYIGTNNNTSFRVRTNGAQHLLVDSLGDVRIDGANAGTYALSVYGANTLRFGVTGFGGVTTNGGTLTTGTNTYLSSARLNVNYPATNAGVGVKNTAASNYAILAQSTGAINTLAVGDSGLIIKAAAVSLPILNTTTTQTLNSQNYTVNVDATDAVKTITLPSASLSNAVSSSVPGRVYVIRKSDATGNTVTINTTSSQTVNGATSYILSSQYKYVTVQSDGSNWMIIGNN